MSGGRRRKAEAREKEKEQERRENQPADGGRSARKRRAADSEKKRVRNLQEQYKQLSAVRVVERGSGHFSKVRTLGAAIRRLEDLQQLGSSVSQPPERISRWDTAFPEEERCENAHSSPSPPRLEPAETPSTSYSPPPRLEPAETPSTIPSKTEILPHQMDVVIPTLTRMGPSPLPQPYCQCGCDSAWQY